MTRFTLITDDPTTLPPPGVPVVLDLGDAHYAICVRDSSPDGWRWVAVRSRLYWDHTWDCFDTCELADDLDPVAWAYIPPMGGE